MRHFATLSLACLCFALIVGFRPNVTDASTNNRDVVPCSSGGSASGYPCNNVNLLSHMPLNTLTGAGIEGNDSWGWTDSRDGREYALMGLEDGTAFVDITNPVEPILLGHLETHTTNSSWRDIKVHSDHAFIGSEAGNHGVQVFDLRQLRDVLNPPVTFEATAHYSNVGSSHNMVSNEDSDFIYAVGANSCAGGLHMINVRTPDAPTFAGCFSADGYTHDAQCVMYNGPDSTHVGKEICINSNEDTVTIVDVTDKSNPNQLSRTPYSGSEYTHQGWLTEDHAYFISNDELDEVNNGHNTFSYIWDVRDLDAPSLIGVYNSGTGNIDHNLYVKDGLVYQANYRAGLRILDAADIANANLAEIGYFDIYPSGNGAAFNGAWSTFPYFDSGVVIISGIEQGLFMVRPTFEAGYALGATPSRLAQCGDGSQQFSIDAEQILDFNTTANLTISNVPAGVTITPSSAQIAPGGSVMMTLDATGAATGVYSINIEGDAGGVSKSTSLLFNLTQIADAPTPVAPATGSDDVGRRPILSWAGDDSATSYVVQVSTAADFSSFVLDTTTQASSIALPSNLDDATTYYWRVATRNQCGESDFSTPASFTTLDAPSVDPNMTNTLLDTSFESGSAGWTVESGWVVDNTDAYEGNSSYFIDGPSNRSRHRLISPPVQIPADQSPALLSFWQKYELERGSIGCYDSAQIEISTNGGANWQRLTDVIYGSTYNGQIARKATGSITSVPVWCGEVTEWEKITVDLSGYVGEEVMIRFQFESDQSIASDGWRVDNIQILSTGEETGPMFKHSIFLPFLTNP